MSAPSANRSPIPARERLIVALDVPDADQARALVERLGDEVVFYKIGLELAMSGRYFELMRWLLDRDKRVFADLKLYDIPATVGAAVRRLAGSGASYLTVHGDRAVVAAAADAKGAELRVLAVTVLTSATQEDVEQMGVAMDLESFVSRRARQAIEAGADGVIASGLEASRLRAQLGPIPLIVTPGIRPRDSAGGDDQRRVVTARDAIRAGADQVVVGRPVRGAADPAEAARALQAEIADALG